MRSWGKKQQEDYAAELQKSHERWAYIYEFGSSDPHWEDGSGLHLVRNHIIYYRGKIEETMQPEDYPEIYYKEIPPEVDRDYMARHDELRANAKASLAIYKADPNYRYILRHQDDYTPKTKKNLCIDAVIGYATGLEHFIETDSLVDMRRHENAESYLKSFEDCAQKMRDTPAEEMQLTLFSLSADGLAEPDDEDFDEDYDEDEDEEFGGMAMM